ARHLSGLGAGGGGDDGGGKKETEMVSGRVLSFARRTAMAATGQRGPGGCAMTAVATRQVPTEFRSKTNGTILSEDFGNIRLALKKLGTTITYDSFARVALVNGGILDEA